jgi:hypothetical protein
MPRGDGTGPWGSGAKTGRGMGYCAGSRLPGFQNSMSASGFGRGAGRGWRQYFHTNGFTGWLRRGFGFRHDANINPDLERERLKTQAKTVEAELDQIKVRLRELESTGT